MKYTSADLKLILSANRDDDYDNLDDDYEDDDYDDVDEYD